MFAEETWADAHGNYEPGDDERDRDGGIVNRICARIKVLTAGEDRRHGDCKKR